MSRTNMTPNQVRAKKRRAVIHGMVAGESTKEIAAKLGCGVRNVRKLKSEPATYYLLAEALKPHRTYLTKLIGKALKVVEDGLSAVKETPIDHFNRLKSVERLSDFLEMAQGKPPEPKPEADPSVVSFTWEQYTAMFKRHDTHQSDSKSHVTIDTQAAAE